MAENGAYQRPRSDVAYLKLTTVADRLAEHLDEAKKGKLSHTAFLWPSCLKAEVSATEQRKLDGRPREGSIVLTTNRALGD